MFYTAIQYISLFIFIGICCLIGAEQSPGLLIINMKDEAILPRNFRATNEGFKLEIPPLPSREGFNNLNLSGSGQFSEKSFGAILKHLKNPSHVYLLDLRQECHGYIDGAAVSWYGLRDWSNVGKTVEEIEREESVLLEQALKKQDVVLGRIVNKDIEDNEEYDYQSIPVKVNRVATEKQMAEKYHVNYKRIPITDHVAPDNYSVDRFITFVKSLPEDHWLHIHCSAGVGRTTTFMAMYDMMKNAKKVSFDDIIKRQWYIGGRELTKLSDSPWKHQLMIDRVEFLRQFYEYSKTNQNNFTTSWSMYLLQKASQAGKTTEALKKDKISSGA